jgi:RNA polymerase sigma-70 factor (ECF subfamily)
MDQGAENYAKYLHGDNAGLEWLVREYRHGLILYINGIVKDMYTAEDLCEDTFFRLITKKPRFDNRSSFKTWLYKIGRNIAYDGLRRQGLLQHAELSEADAEADRASLEAEVIKTDRQKVLLKKLQTLSEYERELIWLSYYEDMSAADVARLTGKKVAATQKALSRAREKLRIMMEKEGYGNEDE